MQVYLMNLLFLITNLLNKSLIIVAIRLTICQLEKEKYQYVLPRKCNNLNDFDECVRELKEIPKFWGIYVRYYREVREYLTSYYIHS